MAYQNLQLKLIGKNAIIPHNGQTADPRNHFSKAMKEISGKRKKTDADLDQLALIEFLAGLYVEDGDIVLPDHVIESAIVAGAKKSKSGVQAKTAVFVTKGASLEFDGKPDVINSDTLKELFECGQYHLSAGVKVGTSKVIRTRPCLRRWSATIELEYDDEFVNRSQVVGFVRDAGRQVGLCDWRPKYGRFEVEEVA